MTINQFQQNIIQWATDRGIYEHSTIQAQTLKAVSEMGELADAVIKGDKDGVKDAIGDVCTCLVSVAHMAGGSFCGWAAVAIEENGAGTDKAKMIQAALSASYGVGALACDINLDRYDEAALDVELAVDALTSIAICHGFTLQECLEAAWLEIKDRRGKMVPGGAFVKD